MPAVTPVILLPEQAPTERVPSFMAVISMEPWGSVEEGFSKGDIEKVTPYSVSASTTLVAFTIMMDEVVVKVHWILLEAFVTAKQLIGV